MFDFLNSIFPGISEFEKVGLISVIGIAVAALIYAVSLVFQILKYDKGTKQIERRIWTCLEPYDKSGQLGVSDSGTHDCGKQGSKHSHSSPGSHNHLCDRSYNMAEQKRNPSTDILNCESAFFKTSC